MEWKRTSVAVALLIGLVTVCGACAASTPVEEAPLETERERQLRDSLIGTWQHIQTVDQQGNRQPVEGVTVTWTFHEDGTGGFKQKVPDEGVKRSREFEWHLEGRNLVLESQSDGVTKYYRAETWSMAQMKWFNYGDSNYYVVRSVQ